MNKTVFILGNNIGLSLAELFSVFNKKDCQLVNQVAVFDLSLDKKQAEEVMQGLGGSIKVGELLFSVKKEDLKVKLKKAVLETAFKNRVSGKFNFAFSTFSGFNFDYKDLAIELKETFKKEGISSRWVRLEGKATDSATSFHNKLTEVNGVEFLIFKDNSDYMVAKVLALQPFSDFSHRDYGRPQRDSFSGMLPPKLAKTMLNIAKFSNEKKLLDPFCGSGTVLSEALLLGAHDVYGSDISKKAISDSRENINWLKKKYNLSGFNLKLSKERVENLSKSFKDNFFDIIVTEPYLGPQRGRIDFLKIKKELENLYSQALKEFSKVLKPQSLVVMVWPIFSPEINPVYLDINLQGFQKQEFEFLNKNNLSTFRQTLVYGRKEQRLWREIVILKKP
ncbi:MAG: methyltransferase domain-containing protein [Candidatus Pacebacteria bacterium]|nr:methyltransferase domain-containing protein [Candidatus Paceibacterota bacterium]